MENLAGCASSLEPLSNQLRLENTNPELTPLSTSSKERYHQFKTLLIQFESLSNKSDIKGKVEIALRICDELAVHLKMEDEIFKSKTQTDTDLEGALRDKVARDLTMKIVSDLHDITGTHPLYDDKVKALGQYIDLYIREDEFRVPS